MTLGTLKCTTIEDDDSNSITVATLTSLDTNKANLAGATFTGDITLNAQEELRLADSDSSNFVALKSPATVASNVTLTFPATAGSNTQVLSTNGSGVLSWVDNPDTDTVFSVAAEHTYTAGQRGEITNVDISSGAIDIDFDLSNNFIVIVDEEIDDIDYSNITEGQTGSIFFQYTGAHVVGGWDAATRWAGGTGGANNAPTFTATNGQVDRVDYIITRDQAASGGNLRVQMVATLNYAD